MSNKEFIELVGVVEDIIFRNDDNGYTVLELSTDDYSVTAVGYVPAINAGEEVHLLGSWTKHTSYGDQFAIESYTISMPNTSAAILRYLSSNAIKGVGPAIARKLVNEFGDETLEIMEKEPERLATIKGISKQKAKQISLEVRKVFGMKELMLFLEKYNITPQETVKIWKIYGESSMDIIRENPYAVCADGINISFEKADIMAAKMDLSKENDYRIIAGIFYVLNHNSNNGHTCLPKEKLKEVTAKFLETDEKKTSEILEDMILNGSLIQDTLNEKEFVFTNLMHNCETYIAARILMMLRCPPENLFNGYFNLEQIEKEQGIEYAGLQKEAIIQAMTKGLLILTGGPGTGKTTTLNAIIRLYKKSGLKVMLAGPTGRAAQRMSEVTGCEAKTIHRLLEVEWDSSDNPSFKRNERNMLECDALILDELSMVDSQLFSSVVKALPMGCRLIMVGDCDQLPSVGAGNVLGDLIASKVIPVVQLTEIFRQSMESLIVTNAHRIVNGEMPKIDIKNNDFFLLKSNNPSNISDTIIDLCSRRLPKSYNYSPLNDIQVLCPGRKGILGVTELNKKLQDTLNPQDGTKKEIISGLYTLRQGDKVMQIRNNYNIPWEKQDGTTGEGVFNGDVGILCEVNKVSSTLKVQYDDKTAIYDIESIGDIELAYATTVHKSQGSEFEAVIIPMYAGAPQLYYRNLLYTAVTRAKKLLIMVGNEQTVQKMVDNNKRTKRYSGLKEFLLRGINI